LVLAAVVISPALGGPSLKSLVKKEVKKQLAKKQGAAGPAGPAGASFTASSSLASGETLTGIWAVASSTNQNAVDAIQFSPQLPVGLGPGSVHELPPSNTSSACPGMGQAAAGHLCVYVRASAAVSLLGIFDPASGGAGANRGGALISFSGASSGNPYADGTWAVTAP